MIGRPIINLSRWLLLASFFGASWLWGGTRPWTQEIIAWSLLIVSALFLLGLIATPRLPRIPWPALSTVLLLLILGWGLTWNSVAPSDTPSDTTQELQAETQDTAATTPEAPPTDTSSPEFMGTNPEEAVLDSSSISEPGELIPSVPAFVSRLLCMETMLLITGILGAFCIGCDMSYNPAWVMRLWRGIALTGISIVILGLAQRLTKAPAIFWNIYENTGDTFFGVFRYHANAGAFLNLVTPLMAGLALLGIIKRWSPFGRILWIISALTSFASLFVNVSRGAMLVTGILLLTALLWIWIISPRRYSWIFPTAAIAMLAVTAILVMSFGYDNALARWQNTDLVDVGRLTTYGIITDHILPLTGVFGSGPGSFEPVYSSVMQEIGLAFRGRWDKAHNDHLQTIVEWGWVGYALWMILLLGALLKGALLTGRRQPLTSRILGISGTISLLGVLLHAIVDFPLQIPSIQLCTALIAGMLWGVRRE